MFRKILLLLPSHRNAIYYSTSDLFSQEEFWNFLFGGRYGTRTRGSLLAKQVQLPLCQSPIKLCRCADNYRLSVVPVYSLETAYLHFSRNHDVHTGGVGRCPHPITVSGLEPGQRNTESHVSANGATGGVRTHDTLVGNEIFFH